MFTVKERIWVNIFAVARLEACPLGMQAAPSSIPTSGTFFPGDLVMKKFLRPFSLFHWFKKSSCQLLAKECAVSTGKLPRRLAQEQCNWPRPKWPKMCWRADKQKSNQTKISTEICPGYRFKIQLSEISKTSCHTCSHKSIFIKLQFIFSVRIKFCL